MRLRTKKRVLWYITVMILLLSPYIYLNSQLQSTEMSDVIVLEDDIENTEIQWGEDDSQIAVGSTTGIHLLNADTGKVVVNITDQSDYRPMRLPENLVPTRDMDWNYDHGLIALSLITPDNIRIFSTQTKSRANIIEESPTWLEDNHFYITDLQWRPGTDQLLYSTSDGRIKLWDSSTNASARLVEAPEWIQQVSWDSTGDRFVFNSGDQLHIFDIRMNNVTQSVQTPGSTNAVIWQQDTIIAAMDDGLVSLYTPTLEEGRKIELSRSYDIIDARVNPQQTELLITPYGENSLLFEMEQFKLIGELSSMGLVDNIPSWNHAGDRIVYDNGNLHLWDLESVYTNFQEYQWKKYGGSGLLLLIGVTFAGMLKYKAKLPERENTENR